MPSIIVFSHLRWDFVYQRPQHILTRMAQRHPVFYIEEPVFDAGPPHLEIRPVAAGVQVVRPHINLSDRDTGGFHDSQLPILRELLRGLVQSHATELHECIAWFYTPMALPLLQEIPARLVVYDCMDELSAFLHAPRQLTQREGALLKVADIVFTGGPSLYRAKRQRYADAQCDFHCFTSSVDAAHFRLALGTYQPPEEQARIARPRLGFYGVLDERFDSALIAAVADAHCEWQIILIGPTAKIDPLSLPRRPNIHYFGQQPYEALPGFLASWDLCLLPFARNEATRFISPTKVLEYMAAEKAIVSTRIADVAEPYGHIVYLGDTPEQFISACKQALYAPEHERLMRRYAMRQIVANTSWDQSVAAMQGLIAQKYAAKCAASAALADTTPAAETGIEHLPSAFERYRCIVAGGGPTGLAAAYHLGADALLLERNATVGGLCRSIQEHGFTFDHAGHIMFSTDPYVLDLYRMLLGDNVHWQNREAWVYSKGVHTRYPFQGALYGLPPKVLKECLIGAIEAQMGKLKHAQASTPAHVDCCADGTDAHGQAARSGDATIVALQKPPRNFEEFIYRTWGAGVAKHFAIPYNQKLWAVPLSEMETSWLGGRVPLPDLEQMIEGALEPVAKPMGPNARFGYPLKGGFQALMQGFVPHIAARIECNAQIVRIDPLRHVALLADGRRYRYDHLISTLPLPELIRMMGNEASTEIHHAAAALRHVSVRCVHLGVALQPGEDRLTDKHWIYYPEDTVFHRIFVQGNASPHCNPPGGFGLTCEISYSPHKPLICDGPALIERCVADCVKVGMMTSQHRLITARQIDIPYAYVVYDHTRAANVAQIRDWLATHDILLAGRYSEWEYYNSDHAFIAGRKAAEAVRAGQRIERDRLGAA